MSQEIIKIRLLPADALEVDVDVLALKYAQANYGLDTHVSRILTDEGKDPSLMRMDGKKKEKRGQVSY